MRLPVTIYIDADLTGVESFFEPAVIHSFNRSFIFPHSHLTPPNPPLSLLPRYLTYQSTHTVKMKPTLALLSFITLVTATSVPATNTPNAVAARDAVTGTSTEPAVDKRLLGGFIKDKVQDKVEDKIKDKVEDKAKDKVEDKVQDKVEDKAKDKVEDKAKDKPDVDIPKPKNDDKDKDKPDVNVNVKGPKGKDGDESAASGLMGVDVRVLVVGLVGAGVGAVFL
jgi:hypothetical protein